MKETTDPEPHGENVSVYELYRQLITPEQARHVDRLLREMSTYDENSYPYVHGLLTTLQFRVMARTPMAAAEAICLTLKPFEAKLQAVLNLLEEQSKWCKPRTTAKLVEQKGIIRRVLGWPLNRQHKGRLAIFLQESIEDFEEVVAYRARWGYLFCIIAILGSVHN